MKKQFPMATPVMLTLANGRANSGYIPNNTAFDANTFHVSGSRLKSDCAEQWIADGLTKLVSQCNGK